MSILDALKTLYNKVTSKSSAATSIAGAVEEMAKDWPETGGEPTADATTETPGLVKQAANVAAAVGDTPTKTEFDGLLTALKDAGIMAADG